MTVFITSVEKSCGKTIRGLLLLKKYHEGKQWGCLLLLKWGCLLLLKKKPCGKIMRAFITTEEISWRKAMSVFITSEEKSWGRTMRVFVTTEEKSWRKPVRVFVTSEEKSRR